MRTLYYVITSIGLMSAQVASAHVVINVTNDTQSDLAGHWNVFGGYTPDDKSWGSVNQTIPAAPGESSEYTTPEDVSLNRMSIVLKSESKIGCKYFPPDGREQGYAFFSATEGPDGETLQSLNASIYKKEFRGRDYTLCKVTPHPEGTLVGR